MMKRIAIMMLMIMASLSVWAQPRARGGERIHAIKVGYLTDRLQLTPAQAAAFWPIYENYEADLRDARRVFREQYRRGTAEDNAEANRVIEDHLDYQQQVLAINRKYKDRMLQVISPQQLATLYEAERDFKKLLLLQLRGRRR